MSMKVVAKQPQVESQTSVEQNPPARKPSVDYSKSAILSCTDEPFIMDWNRFPLTPATMHVTEEMRKEGDKWLARIAAMNAAGKKA